MPRLLPSDLEDSKRTISDPTTGEDITFIETAEESGGHRVVMRVGLAPGTVVPPHAHPFEEAFECTEGQLQFRVNGRCMELLPGGAVTVPANVVHGLGNLSQAPAAVRIVGTPGPIAEHSLRIKFLLSRDGYLPTGGGPPKQLLLGAAVLHRAGALLPAPSRVALPRPHRRPGGRRPLAGPRAVLAQPLPRGVRAVPGSGGQAVIAQQITDVLRQALVEHRLLSSDSTTRLLTPHVATQGGASYSHYGYGVWMEMGTNGIRKRFVEGSDPGVAFRSSIYPEQEMILTRLGNTGQALWPIYTELEALLSL